MHGTVCPWVEHTLRLREGSVWCVCELSPLLTLSESVFFYANRTTCEERCGSGLYAAYADMCGHWMRPGQVKTWVVLSGGGGGGGGGETAGLPSLMAWHVPVAVVAPLLEHPPFDGAWRPLVNSVAVVHRVHRVHRVHHRPVPASLPAAALAVDGASPSVPHVPIPALQPQHPHA